MRTELYSVRSSTEEVAYINNNLKRIATEINANSGIKILFKTEIDYNPKKLRTDIFESFEASNPPELHIFLNALDSEDISSFTYLFSPLIEALEKEIAKNQGTDRSKGTPHIKVHTIDGLKGNLPAYCFTFRRRKFLVLPRISLTGAELSEYVSEAVLKSKDIFADAFKTCPNGFIFKKDDPEKKGRFFSFLTKKSPAVETEDSTEEILPEAENSTAEIPEVSEAVAPKEKKTLNVDTTEDFLKESEKEESPEKTSENKKTKKKKSRLKNFFFSFIPMKGDKKKDIILKIVVLIAIVTFFVGAYLLFKFYIIDPAKNDADMKEIQKIFYSVPEDEHLNYTDAEGNTIDVATDETTRNWAGVQKVNKEIIGWVKMNNTKIDYPVLYHKGDTDKTQFYLYKNYKKEYSEFGSIFLDYRCTVGGDSKHVILHGHNMGSDKDSMFGSLVRYTIKDGRTQANPDYYKSHALVNFDTPVQNGEWIVFAVMKIDVANTKDNVFDYLRTDFNSDAQFMNFIYNIKERSYFDVDVPINEDDRIITLSTCSYETDNMRTIVVARKVRNGEDVSKYINSVKGQTPKSDVYTDFLKEYDNIKWYDGKEKPTGEVDLEYMHQVEMYTVKFYDANGKVIRTEKVRKGEDAVGIVGAPPVKKSDSTYHYKFLKWSTSYKKVTKDLHVKPIYEKVRIPAENNVSPTAPLTLPDTTEAPKPKPNTPQQTTQKPSTEAPTTAPVTTAPVILEPTLPIVTEAPLTTQSAE